MCNHKKKSAAKDVAGACRAGLAACMKGSSEKRGKFIVFLSATLKTPQTRRHRFTQRRVLLDRLGNESEKFVFYQALSNARGDKADTLSELDVRAPMTLQRRAAQTRAYYFQTGKHRGARGRTRGKRQQNV